MIACSEFVGGKRLTIRCEQRVSLQAKWVLAFLRKFEQEGHLLSHGTRIEMGWVILTIAETDGTLVLLGPDFERNPFFDTTDDLTVFLEVQGMQNDILRRLDIEGARASFQDKIVIAKGALDQDRVYLERTPDASKGDSGWYIGPVAVSEEQPQLDAVYVFELLKSRRSLLQVLPLPPGYLVVFNGDQIEAILNKDNVGVWHSS
jgi:hypothetical protein